MKNMTTFTDAGWDFITIWYIEEGITYPLLQELPIPPPVEPEPSTIASLIWMLIPILFILMVFLGIFALLFGAASGSDS